MRDILGGSVPDIVMLSSYNSGASVHSLTACLLNKDIFVDLYPYIDADPNLSREDFLPNILQSTEKDGALPTILPSFCVRTAAGSNRDVAADAGLTMADYDALRAVNPAVFPNSERGDVLQDILQCAGAQYVDWQAGQAHFDTPAFAHLLEAMATLPSFDDLLQSTPDLRGLWQAGDPALLTMNITDWNALATPQDLFGEEWTLTGFPSDQATGRGSAIVPRLQFGISSTCEDPEGAWAFLRLFLLPQFQQKLSVEAGYEGFPLRQDALQRAAERPHIGYSQLTESEDASSVTLSGQTVDRFLALVGELDTLWNTEPDLFAIVTEEAEAYYNGRRSAEDAAAIIQNRVQTYLDEQG